MKEKLRILIVSAGSLDYSANLALNLMTDLKERGHEVDFLTTDRHKDDIPDVYSVDSLKCPVGGWSYLRFLAGKILKPVPVILYLNKRIKGEALKKINVVERFPLESPESFIKAVPGPYDVVLPLFWSGAIASKLLKAFYDKWRCAVVILPPDFLPFSGGCNDVADCASYDRECRKCPMAIPGVSYATHDNMKVKKRIYNEIPVLAKVNTFMKRIIMKSGVIDSDKLVVVPGFPLDTKEYAPGDRRDARASFGVPEDAFVIFAGATAMFRNRRKGWPELQASLTIFMEREGAPKDVVLMLAGLDSEKCASMSPMPAIPLPLLDVDSLIRAYNAADVFVCPSILDAGPSMVNQAMMCGTPVVGFEIGTAIDVLVDGVTGYMAHNFDVGEFADGISKVYHHPDPEALRASTRDFSLSVSTREKHTDILESMIYELVGKHKQDT